MPIRSSGSSLVRPRRRLLGGPGQTILGSAVARLADGFRTVDRYRRQTDEQLVELVVHDASAVPHLWLIIAAVSPASGHTPTTKLRMS